MEALLLRKGIPSQGPPHTVHEFEIVEKPECCQVAIDDTRPGEMRSFFRSSFRSSSPKRISTVL